MLVSEDNSNMVQFVWEYWCMIQSSRNKARVVERITCSIEDSQRIIREDGDVKVDSFLVTQRSGRLRMLVPGAKAYNIGHRTVTQIFKDLDPKTYGDAIVVWGSSFQSVQQRLK